MKKAVLLLSFLLVVLITSNLFSQELFYPEIEPLLSVEQKVQFDKAGRILQKASGNENNANAIDRKYAKLGQKTNKSDWDKKTWEAKQQRVLAEKNYQIAYRLIFDLYYGIITNASYITSADETKALSLNDEAYSKFEDADLKLIQFRDIPKEQLETSSYEEIKNNLTDIHNLQVNGIRNQISALEIYVNKGVKNENDVEDKLDWEQAQKDNTIASYHKYLNRHPRGKNMYDANNKIRALEKKLTNENYEVVFNENDDPEKNRDILYKVNNTNINDEQGLIFKVQIAASKVDLSEWFINAKAPNANEIEVFYNDEWNKYMVGDFNTYLEAANYRDKLWSTAPDAFIVVFKYGNQIQVTKTMKQ